MNVYINPRGGVEEDYPLHAHTRDFLDKMKAKNRKTNAPMEVGYNSALPALLALEAMKDNKVLGWDPVARKSKALLIAHSRIGLQVSAVAQDLEPDFSCLRLAAPARDRISATPTIRTMPATTRDAVARFSLMYCVACAPYL